MSSCYGLETKYSENTEIYIKNKIKLKAKTQRHKKCNIESVYIGRVDMGSAYRTVVLIWRGNLERSLNSSEGEKMVRV